MGGCGHPTRWLNKVLPPAGGDGVADPVRLGRPLSDEEHAEYRVLCRRYDFFGGEECEWQKYHARPDVWDLWDITLRDFIILDRYGVEFARVNLTYNNHDPTYLGEC